MKKPQFVSLIAIFASLNIILDSLMGLPELSSGVWFSWIFIAEPITGIVLGPYAGFLSTLIGVMIGNCIYFRGPYEFLFTLGAPIGAMTSGFLSRKEWKAVWTYFTALLMIYFVTPISWQLPIWGMWDTYLAYAVLILATILVAKRKSLKLQSKGLIYTVALCTFIGLEADVLFRIFVFIPCQTYKIFYDYGVEALRSIWVLGAAETPIKVAISILVASIIVPPLIKALNKMGLN